MHSQSFIGPKIFEHNKPSLSGLSVRKIIQPITDYFLSRNDTLLVFLFGSHASNHITSSSDIDIAVYFRVVPNIDDLNTVRADLSGILKKEIDLAVLNQASPILRMQVLKKGILVLEGEKNQYSIYYGDTVKQYDDLKIIRAESEAKILKGRIYA
ncbi:MAG: nucleotidyltransferase domain-containing protein [Nitrospira sp.]|nr:nucleotidyltransferase domain-containing protein [bacterium]MBL7049446.1 nucleotidyltransferase domain-containing protein [Nitrospira sp.]